MLKNTILSKDPKKKKKKGNFVYDTDAESRRYKKTTLQGGKLKRYPNTGI